jgi:hypothetical protein
VPQLHRENAAPAARLARLEAKQPMHAGRCRERFVERILQGAPGACDISDGGQNAEEVIR